MTFQGPLGVWPYPFINLVLALAGRAGKTAAFGNPPKNTGTSNVEEWSWVDSAGQKRVLTVHRRVE